MFEIEQVVFSHHTGPIKTLVFRDVKLSYQFEIICELNKCILLFELAQGPELQCLSKQFINVNIKYSLDSQIMHIYTSGFSGQGLGTRNPRFNIASQVKPWFLICYRHPLK